MDIKSEMQKKHDKLKQTGSFVFIRPVAPALEIKHPIAEPLIFLFLFVFVFCL